VSVTIGAWSFIASSVRRRYDTARMLYSPPRLVLVLALVVGLGSCGVAIKRDLSRIQQGQVGFEDMCGLQEYFDAIEAGMGSEPVVASSVESEGVAGTKPVRGGRARFVFEGDFQLDHIWRVLDENWRRLPPDLETTPRIDLEVRWAERAAVKRVVTDEDATLTFDGKSYSLPYHVCLSELLFGRALYAQRIVARGLRPAVSKPLDLALDAGAPPEPDARAPGGTVEGEPRW
jgi:hypothetical protein